MGLAFLLLIGAAIWVALGTLAILHRLTHPARLTYGVAVAKRLPASPAELGMSFEEGKATYRDGSSTLVWVIRGGRADGPCVVISHGWSHSHYSVTQWAKILHPLASRIITYDLRGQGESTAGKARLGTTEVDDLLELLDQFAPDEAERGIVLAGQSMGGGVSIVAAGRVFEQGLTERYPVAGVLVEGVYRLGMQPIEGYFRKRGVPLWPYWLTVAGHLSFWYTTARKFDRAMHARKLRCPLLAFHSEGDVTCPAAAARQIVQAAGEAGNDARLVMFEQPGHTDLAELDPQRYAAALDTFFQQIRAHQAGGAASGGTASGGVAGVGALRGGEAGV